MLIALMYHRVSNDLLAEGNHAFANHLSMIVQQFPIVAPGDELIRKKINICLTFDDAYFDFYHCVFPLLQKFNIKAVLAIPVGLIAEDTNASAELRLRADCLNSNGIVQTQTTLCTWREIREMVASGLVIPACHSLTHQKITHQNLEQEVIYAQKVLHKKLQVDIDTFVYPYGRMTRSINRIVNKHYRYSMRIGSALNYNWKNLHNVIYRVNADEFWLRQKPVGTLTTQLYLWLRFLSNVVRFK